MCVFFTFARAGRLFVTSTRHYYQKIHRKASKAMVPTIKNDRRELCSFYPPPMCLYQCVLTTTFVLVVPIVHQENATEGEENATAIEETEVVEIVIAVVRADAAAAIRRHAGRRPSRSSRAGVLAAATGSQPGRCAHGSLYRLATSSDHSPDDVGILSR